MEESRFELLLKAYEIERQDQMSLGHVSLALLSAGLTFVSAAAAVLVSRHAGGLILSVAPAPIWILLAFFVLTAGNVIQRAELLVVLEKELETVSRNPGSPKVPSGFRRSERIYGKDAPWQMMMMTLLTYAGCALLALGFTALTIVISARHSVNGWWISSLAVYAIVAVATALAAPKALSPQRIETWPRDGRAR